MTLSVLWTVQVEFIHVIDWYKGKIMSIFLYWFICAWAWTNYQSSRCKMFVCDCKHAYVCRKARLLSDTCSGITVNLTALCQANTTVNHPNAQRHDWTNFTALKIRFRSLSCPWKEEPEAVASEWRNCGRLRPVRWSSCWCSESLSLPASLSLNVHRTTATVAQRKMENKWNNPIRGGRLR